VFKFVVTLYRANVMPVLQWAILLISGGI
jgi:hypothetical protein